MPKSDVRRISDILQRNASNIVASAAHALGPLSAELWGYNLQDADATPRNIVAPVYLAAPSSADESVTMGAEGFRRLGNVVMMSVLVDEPGLIADDLTWLECTGSQPGSRAYKPANVHRLIRIYMSSCSQVLGAEDFKYVEGIIERALQLISPGESSPR